jgi:hypothetical protein
LPARHAVQLSGEVMPSPVWYVPASQVVQLVAPASFSQVPAGQATHLPLLPSQYALELLMAMIWFPDEDWKPVAASSLRRIATAAGAEAAGGQ